MGEYYKSTDIRNGLLELGELTLENAPSNLSENWEHRPCNLQKKGICKGKCTVRLGIVAKNPNIGRFPLEIIFIRNRNSGYILTDNIKIEGFIQSGLFPRPEVDIF